MADSKITDLTALTGANTASGDLFVVVDVSDTTMAASGTDKKITGAELLIGLGALPLAGGTMTGTITSTLGAITTSKPFLSGTVTWDANVDFESIVLNAVTGSNFGINSNLLNLKRDGTSVFRVGGIDGSGNIGCVARSIEHTGGEWHVGNAGYRVGKDQGMRWSSTDFWSGSLDTGLYRKAAGATESNTGTVGSYGQHWAKQFSIAPSSTNGQSTNIKCLTELTTIAAAATTDTTIQMPANAIILSVSVRVTTAIPTATNFTVGDAGSATRFSTAAVSSALNSTDAGTKAAAYYNSTAASVRITPDATPASNTGRVRVTITYIDVTVPTS